MKASKPPVPPYEGEEPYLYFAFAEADSRKVRRIFRALLERGCRVWYCLGPAGSSDELLRRQRRAEGAELTLVYLSDAVCADRDTNGFVMVKSSASPFFVWTRTGWTAAWPWTCGRTSLICRSPGSAAPERWRTL